MRYLVGLLLTSALGASVYAEEPGKLQPPFLVLQSASLDEMERTAKLVATRLHVDKEWTELQHRLGEALPAKALEGIDRARPLGLYARQRDGATALFLLVPIKDENRFLAGAKATGWPDEKKPRAYLVEPGDGRIKIALRFSQQYAYLSFAPAKELANEELLPPDKVLNGTLLLSIKADLTALPPEFIEGLTRTAKGWLDTLRPAKLEASKTSWLLRRQLVRLLEGWLEQWSTQGKTFQLSITYDAASERLRLQATLAARAGTTLARELDTLATTSGRFTELTEATALRAQVTLDPGKELRKELTELLNIALQEATGQQVRQDRPHALLPLLQPTLEAGTLELLYQISGGTDSTTPYTLLAGVGVRKGNELERKLKGLCADPKTAALLKAHPALRDNTALYELVLAEKDRAQSLKVLGKQALYLAVRDDLLLFAAGDNGPKAIEEIVARKAAPGPAVRLTLTPTHLARLLETKVPPGKERGLDMSLRSKDGLQLEFAADLESLRLLSRLAAETTR